MFTYTAPHRSRISRAVGFLFLAVIAIAGCSSRRYYANIDYALEAGRPEQAMAVLEHHQSSYGSKSQALYFMDLGMLQHIAGQFVASNESLSKAEDLTETLYTRRIRSEVEAFLTTDNALPYEGEDFEKVLLNVFMAMNYAELGLLDDALVEARKVDHKLGVLHDRNGGKMAYSKDPLARYLSGVLYEAEGNLSDALVSYRLALDAFQHAKTNYGTPVPDLLKHDLLRLSEALGLTDEHEEYRRQFPGVTWQPHASTKDLGEVVLLAYEGRAPLKHDVFIDVPFSPQALAVVLATKGVISPDYHGHRAAQSVLYGLTGHIIRLAVPRFMPRRTHIVQTEARALGGAASHVTRLAFMEDLTAIAIKDLDERIARTTVKAVARAAWKYALAEGFGFGVRSAVGRNGGDVAGALAAILARMIALASEEADKRSWATLPDRIQLGRMLVPPGTYNIELRYAGLAGETVTTQTLSNITVRAGEKRFVSTRVMQ